MIFSCIVTQNGLTQEVTVDSVEQRNKTIGWVSLLCNSVEFIICTCNSN